MDDQTKRHAARALECSTKMLEGLSEAANCHDGEPQDGDLTVNRGLFRLLDGARALLADQMRATPTYRVGKHPIPGLFPIAARTWDFGVRALSGDFSPSAFRAVISDLVGELQQAEEAAHNDLDRAGYDDPPPALPHADQATLDAVLAAANALSPEPDPDRFYLDPNKHLDPATLLSAARQLTDLAQVRRLRKKTGEAVDALNARAARELAWERVLSHRAFELAGKPE